MPRTLFPALFERLRPRAWPARFTAWRERARGLDFSRPASLEALGLDPTRSVEYSPSPDRHLRALLDGMGIGPSDCILDYGCGKGRAMRAMLDYPFARVDGVELSPVLAEIAGRNFERLRIPASRCRVVRTDAAVFTDLDAYTHFYLYHPFPAVVVREVVANLLASVARRQRCLTVVYHNAVCVADFLRDGRFRVVHETADEEQNRSVILKSCATAATP